MKRVSVRLAFVVLLASVVRLAAAGEALRIDRARPAAEGDIVGYAVLDDVKPAVLYSIVMQTGQASPIGQTSFDNVEGLAFGPDGTLYGIDTDSSRLVTCSVTTGRCTAVGFLGFQILRDAGLAFDCEGQLWLACEIPADLYRVNAATGVATFIGPLGQKVTALAARKGDPACPSGVLALGGELANNLGCLDITAGTSPRFRHIGMLGLDLEDGGIDFDSKGTLWALRDNDLSTESTILTIDPATGQARIEGATLAGFESLAIQGAATLCKDEPPPPPAGRRRAVRLTP